MTVLFAGGGTGGHIYPALALAEALRAERPEVEPHFVGARRGLEARVYPERGVPHTLLAIEPIYRTRPWRNLRHGPAAVRAWWGFARLFRRLRPRLVVGTGGYASGPACAFAALRRVPVAIQEQNAVPGLTTRWLARFARQVHLGFPEAEARIRPGRRTRVFAEGNPVRPPDPGLDRAACRRGFGLDPEGVVALVVGGSQGALGINQRLVEVASAVAAGELPPPPPGFQLLWATGPRHYQEIRARLDAAPAGPWLHAVDYIHDMPRALAAADVAVSRAGAMATSELLAWGIPSILVPYPYAAMGHQTANARALEQAGAAICLEEAGLEPARLWAELTGLAADPDRRAALARAARERGRPDAARAIARHLAELVEA